MVPVILFAIDYIAAIAEHYTECRALFPSEVHAAQRGVGQWPPQHNLPEAVKPVEPDLGQLRREGLASGRPDWHRTSALQDTGVGCQVSTYVQHVYDHIDTESG